MAKKTSSPKKVSPKTANENAMSLADIWDNTDPSEANNNLPPGEHEVRVNGIELRSDKKKGDVAIITYEAIEGDHEGKKLRQLYKLRDADGGKGPGVAFLQRDLELLGYKEIDGKKMPKVLKEISEEQPMVIINAKQSGQYVNAYLQGLPDDVGKSSNDDDDDDDGDSDEIEVGDTVSGKNDDGDKIEGEVLKINAKKGTAVVKDEDDEEHTCDLDDLKKADADADGDDDDDDDDGADTDEPLSVGDDVTFTDPEDDDEELEGEVVKVNEKKETFDAKVGKKTIKGIEFSAIKKEEEEADDDDEIEVGDEVTFEDEDGDDVTGKVKSIDGKIAKVKDDDGKVHKVKLTELTK